jgi:hypothetical protein
MTKQECIQFNPAACKRQHDALVADLVRSSHRARRMAGSKDVPKYRSIAKKLSRSAAASATSQPRKAFHHLVLRKSHNPNIITSARAMSNPSHLKNSTNINSY